MYVLLLLISLSIYIYIIIIIIIIIYNLYIYILLNSSNDIESASILHEINTSSVGNNSDQVSNTNKPNINYNDSIISNISFNPIIYKEQHLNE